MMERGSSRVLWKSCDGVDYPEKHCGNCWYGVMAKLKRNSKAKYDCCNFKAEIVAEIDGKRLVQSSCSKQENWYWKKIIK